MNDKEKSEEALKAIDELLERYWSYHQGLYDKGSDEEQKQKGGLVREAIGDLEDIKKILES